MLKRESIVRSETSSGQFTPDWLLLAGLPLNTPTNGNASAAPFVAYMDIAGSLFGGRSSHLKASAIVTPALNGEPSSRITIICKICRNSDTC